MFDKKSHQAKIPKLDFVCLSNKRSTPLNRARNCWQDDCFTFGGCSDSVIWDYPTSKWPASTIYSPEMPGPHDGAHLHRSTHPKRSCIRGEVRVHDSVHRHKNRDLRWNQDLSWHYDLKELWKSATKCGMHESSMLRSTGDPVKLTNLSQA